MYTVEEFNSLLDEVFSGRLRLRQSAVREDLLFVEERVGRAVLTGLVDIRPKNRRQFEQRYDDLIRTADGYVKVMDVTRGDRKPCPRPGCTEVLRMPFCETAEVMCRCGASVIGGFYPIGTLLLDYLKKIDPLTDGHYRAVREADEAKRRVDKSDARASDGYLGDILFDEAISQLPKVGYTGKEHSWVRD